MLSGARQRSFATFTISLTVVVAAGCAALPTPTGSDVLASLRSQAPPTNAPSPSPTYPPGAFSLTGAMTDDINAGDTATLLPDGRVLIAGGRSPYPANVTVASAEVYDPKTGSFVGTGSMTSSRTGATATLLPDGKVLIAGGSTESGSDLATAELYDPELGVFAETGSMAFARWGATATLLSNGRVLIAGGGETPPGTNDSVGLASAELYDPESGTFGATGSMKSGRFSYTATLLNDGRVLAAGGLSVYTSLGDHTTKVGVLASAELFDPETGKWTKTGSLSSGLPGDPDCASNTTGPDGRHQVGRYDHTATLLGDGRVLVAGGSCYGYLMTADIYDPTTGTFTINKGIEIPRGYHAAALLSNGKVLLVGGVTGNGTTNAVVAEIYDPATDAFSRTGSLSRAAARFVTATPLRDGRVLVTENGGVAELYWP